MRPEVASQFAVPGTGVSLALQPGAVEVNGEVVDGELASDCGDRRFPIRASIPRFVADSGYTANFGEQWNRYRRTQLDSVNGTSLSRDRLYGSTGWSPEELRGRRVLEVGCGAGRFTEVLLHDGADVYAIDYSEAVDACWQNHGPHPRLTVAQADLYTLPFHTSFFDVVLCFGVLQHTPDVRRAFHSLVPFLRPGGRLAVDVYLRVAWIFRWTSKNWYRPLTRRLPSTLLRRIVEWYVPRWLPWDTRIARVKYLRRIVQMFIPCWNYTGVLPLNSEQLREWAILDTFDALAPAYDTPQTIDAVRGWFREAPLQDVSVRLGGNGIVGTATRV